MEIVGDSARGTSRISLLFLTVVLAVALGTVFLVNVSSNASGLTMPSVGVVTVTGYGSSSPANPSTQSRSVVLTDSQAAALRRRISEIPTLKQSAGPIICMENETVFTIDVRGVGGSSKAAWVARAERCPAPGILYVHGEDVGRPEAGRYCTLKTLLLSIFPEGTVSATRKELSAC